MDVEAVKDRGRAMGLKPGRQTVSLSSTSRKRAWGITRRGALVAGDVVANEGLVHNAADGKYTHEVWLAIGDDIARCFTRADSVYAFAVSNVKEQ